MALKRIGRPPVSIPTDEPGHGYRTMNLAGIFALERGLFMMSQNKSRFYHDGRFPTLLDTVKSYNERFALGLSEQEELDLVEYLKSLQIVLADQNANKALPVCNV